MRPMPAVTAANAPTKSGAPPLRSWMPTLESVATIVRMPSAVVFICVYFRVRLCPPNIGDIIRDWSWDWDRVAILVVHGEVGSPVNKLLRAIWNRDANEIAE